MLSGETHELPEAVTKAFNHWPKISSSLHDLLGRASAEAIVDDAAILARMALQAIEENNYPANLAQKVRNKAQAVLARSAEMNSEKISAAIAEPVRLVEAIDDFIMRGQRLGNVLQHAEARARELLEWCRQLDRELGTIPVRLRKGSTNDH